MPAYINADVYKLFTIFNYSLVQSITSKEMLTPMKINM